VTPDSSWSVLADRRNEWFSPLVPLPTVNAASGRSERIADAVTQAAASVSD
jgi:hypothetical protein